jgi:hypothetical protein
MGSSIAVVTGGLEGGDAVQAHDVARRLVQDQAQAIEAGDPSEHPGEIAQEALDVAVRRGGARDVDPQASQVAPSTRVVRVLHRLVRGQLVLRQVLHRHPTSRD